MPVTRIDSADTSTNTQDDFKVDTVQTDGAGEDAQTFYQNEKWPQYLGYYKKIPELGSAIDAKATWTIGKGFIADEPTTQLLNTIKGFGKDTFNTILENAIRTSHIGGDAFLHIITDDDGQLINLKPLDPGAIKIFVDPEGLITHFEQTSKVTGQAPKRFEVEEMFHLARNRVADEIHGVSIIEKLETIILMRNEAMDDLKTVFHRYVSPFNVWHLDTDDDTEIAAFIAKIEKMHKDKTNLFIPKGAVELERHSIPQFSTLDPKPWIEQLNQYFYQAVGVPDLILGGGKAFTEASAKIAYLAFQQTVEEEQLFVEEQVLLQLGLEIELEFPATIENELISDKAKDGPVNVQPDDTTVQGGGVTNG